MESYFKTVHPPPVVDIVACAPRLGPQEDHVGAPQLSPEGVVAHVADLQREDARTHEGGGGGYKCEHERECIYNPQGYNVALWSSLSSKSHIPGAYSDLIFRKKKGSQA